MGAFAKHSHSDSNEVRLVTRKYRYTNGGVQSQIDLFTAFVLTPKRTSLDPPWSDLELHFCGDEFLRCDLKEWGSWLFIGWKVVERVRLFKVVTSNLVAKGGDGGACKVLEWLLEVVITKAFVVDVSTGAFLLGASLFLFP
ncbi:hypothetical protein Tco_1517275 [Tanacetum coccineum]